MDTAISWFSQANSQAGKNGLLLIADNCDALAVRVLTARGAQRTLDLMYYLWHDDHTGRLLMHEVLAAADRGVSVRLLLDDINTRNDDAFYLAIDSHPNIEVRLFNPSGTRTGIVLRGVEVVLRLFAMTRRMHNKAWIADSEVAIVGGRNLGDAYFDAAETNFRDLDVLLVGPAVQQTNEIFETFWNSESVRPVRALHPAAPAAGSANYPGAEASEGLLDRIAAYSTITQYIEASSDVVWTEHARVISDPPEKVRGRKRRNWLLRELRPIIESAREHLEVITPYFIPGRNGASILFDLVGRGTEVRILTNSLAATDVAAVHGAYANYRKDLLRGGVRLFELQPFARQPKISVFGSKGASLHTKAFTVDDRLGFVGSFNFDPRSVTLNSEMGVLFEDEHLVAQLRQRFQNEISPQTSYQLSLHHNQLRWTGALDGETRQFESEPEASLYRRLVAAVVRALPIESQL
ncbi:MULTISPECIES: phospholipase D family protein [unclassified Mesorhizobium]|uniref:phospholipase D family protein n=1 Tax=unclassified Mesorhizobium TaxID=325217 RepID=UPI001092D636|nr:MULTISPECIES: phospholipase D family protein [unclassified Mesorhizobium]TGP95487.1 phospholipase D family protein [Mesorhizobium sp. M8A.F.Ca.ET.218.01.1.1]TGT18542.1 phospholipase D family protein [Mesorhizobium sp. M8A.F.Ca.ET.213.01.1.1]